MADNVLWLEQEHGRVSVEQLDDGRRHIRVFPYRDDLFVHEYEWTTAYPLDLIKLILEINGVAGLCFEIMRDEDSSFVQKHLFNDLSAYFDLESFRGKRILDFGCGTGASSVILARLIPESTIVGVELSENATKVGNARVQYHGFQNRIAFVNSPSEGELPPDLGRFDLAVMSAVYEHLLPAERISLMPRLWDLVSEGGYLFLNQTPDIRFPFELHTTMLPLINYVPDRVALTAARRLTKRISSDDRWESLLRKGIRGATEHEIIRKLSSNGGSPVLVEPSRNGLRDRIDLYYLNTDPVRLRTVKGLAKGVLKTVRALTGLCLVPDLSLVFHKREEK